MNLDWTPLNYNQWMDLISKSDQDNWMQSWPYALATRLRDFKSVHTVQIKKDSFTIGVCLINQIKLGPLHLIEIQRGPLWLGSLEPVQKNELTVEFGNLFNKLFPRRILRRRRWLPELDHSNANEQNKILEKIGFKLRNETFETSLLDITRSLDEIKMGMRGNWRTALKKSEGHGLILKDNTSQIGILSFLKHYQKFKNEKNFLGPSELFLKEEAFFALKVNKCLVLEAIYNHQSVGGILITINSATATYRASWNTPSGRNINVHNFLIWHAIIQLKNKHYKNLDLGGLLPGENKGLTKFKEGIGGKPIRLLGIYE